MTTYRKPARKAMARIATVATMAGFAAVAFAGVASADTYFHVDNCSQPQGVELCPMGYGQQQSFYTGSETALKVEFTANANHCSDIIAHIFIDGHEWGSNVVHPGQSDGGYRIPVTPNAPHTLGVQAEGVPGGCNTTNTLRAWGGTLHVEPTD
jgi:hypothetical protein